MGMESFLLKYSSNPFVVLSPIEDHNSPILEEGEVQQSNVHLEEVEVNLGPQEQADLVILETPCAKAYLQELHNSLLRREIPMAWGTTTDS